MFVAVLSKLVPATIIELPVGLEVFGNGQPSNQMLSKDSKPRALQDSHGGLIFA
jgi:hypothetical protein